MPNKRQTLPIQLLPSLPVTLHLYTFSLPRRRVEIFEGKLSSTRACASAWQSCSWWELPGCCQPSLCLMKPGRKLPVRQPLFSHSTLVLHSALNTFTGAHWHAPNTSLILHCCCTKNNSTPMCTLKHSFTLHKLLLVLFTGFSNCGMNTGINKPHIDLKFILQNNWTWKYWTRKRLNIQQCFFWIT